MNDPTVRPKETWRPVPGFPGYQVSNLGSVYSNLRGGRELSGGGPRKRYLAVSLYRDGERYRRYIHQLVAENFLSPRPAGLVIRHLDGNPHHNDASNLTWGTEAENAQDRLRHGRDQNGRKTHCKRGHEFDKANTYMPPGKRQRTCRICQRAKIRAYRERSAFRAAGLSAVSA